MWRMKSVYFSILPHVFDQATDIGTIIEYYEEWQNPKYTDSSTRPFWFFAVALFILIFQRILSSVIILYLTRNWRSALYQFCDVLMVKAIWINYKLKLDQPCNPQRFISIL